MVVDFDRDKSEQSLRASFSTTLPFSSSELRGLIREVEREPEAEAERFSNRNRSHAPTVAARPARHFMVLNNLVIPIIAGREVIIGRDCTISDVVLVDDAISRQHARVTCQKGRFFVEDLESTNGTFLNRIQVSGRRGLVAGDELHIGIFKLRFVGENDPQLSGETTPGIAHPLLMAQGHSTGLLYTKQLSDFLTLLTVTHQDGLLQVQDAAGERAVLAFANGILTEATYKTLRNQEAVSALLRSRDIAHVSFDETGLLPRTSASSSINQYIFSWCAAA